MKDLLPVILLIILTYLFCRIAIYAYYAMAGNKQKKLSAVKLNSGLLKRLTGFYLFGAPKGQNLLIRIFLVFSGLLIPIFCFALILPVHTLIPGLITFPIRPVIRLMAGYLYFLYAYIVILGFYSRIRFLKT